MTTNSKKVKRANLSDILDVYSHIKKPRINFWKNNPSQVKYCFVCGNKDGFDLINIINDDLAAKWNLTKSLRKSFDIRESSKCQNCNSSYRSNLQARTICNIYVPEAKNLKDALKLDKFRNLKIAEINACGALHQTIFEHPNLFYSEYMPPDKSVRKEDLDKLTYKDNYFDLVITSETLEHVPNWQRAKKEIRRVLKPGGKHIFTIPTILSRQTRIRAREENGKIVNLLTPSYHGYNRGNTSDYTVFNEFGADFRKAADQLGFKTEIYYPNTLCLSDPNFVFVSTKV